MLRLIIRAAVLILFVILNKDFKLWSFQTIMLDIETSRYATRVRDEIFVLKLPRIWWKAIVNTRCIISTVKQLGIDSLIPIFGLIVCMN